MPRAKLAIMANHHLLVALFEEQDALGMSGTELAARSGLTYQKISRLRRGRHHATIADVEALAAAVKMEVRLVPRETESGY